MSDHEMDDPAPGVDPVLDPGTEALLRDVLRERAALGEGAAVPDMDALVRRSAAEHRRFSPVGIAAAAAIAVLVIGTAIGVAVRRTGDVEVRAASPAELLEALRDPDGQQSYAYESSSTATEGSDFFDCSARTTSSGRVDLRNGLESVQVDGGEVTTDPSGNGSISTSLLPSGWGVTTPFVRFTQLEAFRAQFAVGAGSALPGGTSGPVGINGVGGDIRERFDEIRAAATSVEVVGTETVRGAETSHVIVALDGDALAEARAAAAPAGIAAAVEAGVLTPVEAARMAGATGASAPFADLTDEDLRVEAWIDGDGRIRRLVSTTTLGPARSSIGTIPAAARSTTTYTTTIETFDHGQVQLSLPEAGPDVTELGSLPAEVLRPLDRPESPCGTAPVESMTECTEAAFDDAAAGRTVDELVAEIPKTFEALITPNGWFDDCPMGYAPAQVPTGDQLDMLLGLAKIDPAAADRFVVAAAGVPSLAAAPREMLLYLSLTGCNAVAHPEWLEQAIQFYNPAMIEGGLSKEAYRDLLTLLADPAVTVCPPR